MNPIRPQPIFNGVSSPSADFDNTRSALRSRAFTVVVDLSVARGPNAMLNLPIAGNVFYIDARANTGIARVHFQDQTALSCPFTVFAGFLCGVAFTQIALENDAQPGQFLWIIFGTDLQVRPANAAGTSPLNPMLVVDSSRTTTLSGTAFFATTAQAAVAAQLPLAGIKNPLASNKVVYVKSFVISATVAATASLVFNDDVANNTTLAGHSTSKLAGSAAGITETRIYSAVGALAGNITVMLMIIPASTPYNFKLSEPIILRPGQGVFAQMNAPNTQIDVNFELIEDF